MRGIAPVFAALVGGAVGLLAGYLAFGVLPDARSADVDATPAATAGAPASPSRASAPGTATGTPTPARTPAGARAAGATPGPKPQGDQPALAECTPWIKEAVGLRAEVQQLNDRLAQLDRERQVDQGDAFEFPEDLDEAYRQAALLENFQQALKREGLAGGVSAVDCGEYPCVVYGQLGSREDIKRLLGSGALGMYEGAARDVSVWGFRHQPGEGEARDEFHFGVALFPRDDDEQRGADLARRLNYRKQQMWEATRPK